jgi:hypothetical protein
LIFAGAAEYNLSTYLDGGTFWRTTMQFLARHIAAIAGLFTLAAVLGAGENPVLTEQDPLPVETQWKGKFTQIGTHPEVTFPPELDATLTITRRDGNAVEAELRETTAGLDITFLCSGQLIRNADHSVSLDLRSHGVKGVPNAGFYLINVPYSARINGDAIKGTWQYIDRTEGIDLGGDYMLTRE